MKPPMSYYGGKQQLVPKILSLIPKHTHYVEPFCGGAAVFWAKEPSQHEVINDLDGRVVNFYRVLQTRFDELQSMIRGTLHSEADHARAKRIMGGQESDELARAWAFWVCCTMSFGNGLMKGFAFSSGIREGMTQCGNVTRNKREAFVQDFSFRVQGSEIFCRDAVELIKLKDSPGTFFYIDPPYVSSECGHYKGYTSADFQRLLDVLAKIEGKFLLSSYPESELLAARAAYGWQAKDIESIARVSGKGKRCKSKVECLTWNYCLAIQPIGLFASKHLAEPTAATPIQKEGEPPS